MSCPRIFACELFPYFERTPMIRFWKEKYCDTGHEACARYQQSNAGKLVPLTLLPNGRALKASMLKRPPGRPGTGGQDAGGRDTSGRNDQ